MRNSRIFIGTAILLAGAFMLLDRAGIFDFWRGVRLFWPVLLVLLGLYLIVKRTRQYFAGGILLLWGVLELGKRFLDGFLAGTSTWSILWPVILIVFGLSIIFGRSKGGAASGGSLVKQASGASSDETVAMTALFSGLSETNTSASFKGGSITAAFGGAELSLKGARVPEGTTAVLDVLCLFGGIEIHVPEDWRVQMKTTPLFGGAENKTRQSGDSAEPVQLIVRGTVAFGAVEVNTK